MSQRNLLLQQTGVYCHVFNRGINRDQIFFSSSGYTLFISFLRKYQASQPVTLLAYCLMPNHFHLIVRQNQPYAIAAYMKNVCEHYAKAVNQWLGRSGHLFGSRYKISHIDDPLYLLQLSRYVHLNPVKAGIVESALEWDHSSCRQYCGLTSADELEPDQILSQAGGARQYQAFLEDPEATYSEGSVKYMIDWGDDAAYPRCGTQGSSFRRGRLSRRVAAIHGPRQFETANPEHAFPSRPYQP